MDSDTTIRRTAVMDFIGHTEQVLENNIFWSKIDSGFRDTASTYWIPKTGQQIFFFLFRNNNVQPNHCLGWTNQRNCWKYVMSILKIYWSCLSLSKHYDNKEDAVSKGKVSITTGPLDKYHKT